MYSIQYTETKAAFKVFASNYNSKFRGVKTSKPDRNGNHRKLDDTSKMLRPQHLKLMDEIMQCFAAQLNEHQRSITWKMVFVPDFETSRPILASRMGTRCLKTVSNWLDRLMEAGFIKKKEFRGSCHKFKLQLNLDLFYFVDQNIPCRILEDQEIRPLSLPAKDKMSREHVSNAIAQVINIALVNNNETSGKSDESFGSTSTEKQRVPESEEKKLHHKEESKHLKEKLLIKDVKTVDNPNPSLKATSFKGNTMGQEDVLQNKVSSRRRAVQKVPARSPLTNNYQDYFSNFPHFQEEASTVMSLMLRTIFENLTYHSPRQLAGIVNYLVAEYHSLDRIEVKEKTKELKYRTIAAWKYVKEETDRYIPLNTSKYLDPLNKNGFTRTKKWYEKAKSRNRVIEENVNIANSVLRAWKEFLSAALPESTEPDFNHFIHGIKLSANLGQNLTEAYCKSILISKS
jgi:hypothetical protein